MIEIIKKQKNKLNFIIKGTDAGTWEWNIQTGKTIYNDKWAEMLGYNLEELEPTTLKIWKKIVHPEDRKKAEKNWKKHFRGEVELFDVEIRMKHKNGNWIWINERGKVVSWTEDNKPLKMFGVNINITKRKKQQKDLEFQHRFQKTIAQISSELLEINSANINRKINDSLKKIGEFFEVDRGYIYTFSDNKKFISNTHAWNNNNIQTSKNSIQNLSAEILSRWEEKIKQNKVINISNISKMPEEARAEQKLLEKQNIKSVTYVPMLIDNKLFGFLGFNSVKRKKLFSEEEIKMLKIFADIITSAFSKYLDDERIKNLTFKDSLTGLYNRRYYENELERIDKKRQLPVSIIVADINGLKIINDSFGHKKGDQLLIKSAQILKEETRKEDIIARIGGDEFSILLPQTSQSETEKIIARINKEANETKNDEITVSIAIGSATKTEIGQDINNILKEADNNMYQNKLSESKSTKSKIVKGLLNSLAVKSDETKEHTIRMTKLALEFGGSLGLSNSELNRLSLLSTLHDIGKITINEEVLNKPENLTDKEWDNIKSHTESGYKIAKSSEEFLIVAEEIYSHHERWDGRGYPRGLKGKDIPYLARIISIIDAYDVMTNDRPYSKAISQKEALAEIERCSGTQFDPLLVNKFIDIF